ncbi:MAG: Crp/Fnr family transcriptional regulator [Pseudoruegeria sp.]
MTAPDFTSTVHIQCGTCPIRQRAVCSRCDASELEELDQIKYYRKFDAGQSIVWAGDCVDFVGSVVTGVASLAQTMEDGRRQMVGLLLPSDFVGRPGRKQTRYDVTATTDVLMCCFRKAPFEKLMATTPSVSQRLLEMTLDELDAAREWMVLLGRKTAKEKIASLLVIFARRSSQSTVPAYAGSIIIDLPLTREAMADYLGLTLETVSRQMSALKKTGVIVLQGKRQVIIPDFEQLLLETGDDSDGGMLD